MTEPQWHCYHDRAQDGPLAESELARRFGTRQVPLDALVWSEDAGAGFWRPAREVNRFLAAALAPPSAPVPDPLPRVYPTSSITPAVAPARPAATPPVYRPAFPMPASPATSATPTVPTLPGPPRPWTRYWARTFDWTAGGFVWGLILAVVAPQVLNAGGFVIQLVVILLLQLTEAVLLAAVGTTPGKALFGLRVRTAAGERPGFGSALSRSLDVYFRGLGLGIPLISLFTQLAGYNRLKSEGVTAWDQSAGLVVENRGSGVFGWLLLALIVILAAVGVFAALNPS